MLLMNYSNVAHILSFDIQNVFNTENIRKIDEYDVLTNKYVYKTQAGIIPNFKYCIEFQNSFKQYNFYSTVRKSKDCIETFKINYNFQLF